MRVSSWPELSEYSMLVREVSGYPSGADRGTEGKCGGRFSANALAYSAGVRLARPRCGRARSWSRRHASIVFCASARLMSQLSLRHSSRTRPLKPPQGILNRLARLNELARHAARVRPLLERLARELRAVCYNTRWPSGVRGLRPPDRGAPPARQGARHPRRSLAPRVCNRRRSSVRNRGPSPSASETESILQRSLGVMGLTKCPRGRSPRVGALRVPSEGRGR